MLLSPIKDLVRPPSLGIVGRLRLVSAIIVCLLLVQTIIGGLLLGGLKARQGEMTGEQIPMLVMSTALQADFGEIHSLVNQMRRVVDLNDMTRLEDRAGLLFGRVTTTVEQMRTLAGADPALDAFSGGVAEARENFREASFLARRVVSRMRALETDARTLQVLGEDFRTLADPKHTAVTHALRETLDTPRPDGARPDESWRTEFDRLLLLQDSLRSMTHDVGFAVDVTSALARYERDVAAAADSELAGRDAERVRFALRSLPSTLVRLENGPLRKRIALTVGDLRETVLGESGTLAHVERLRLDRSSMEESQASLLADFDDMSAVIEAHVATIESLAASTATALERATNLTLLVLIVTATLVLLVVLATGFVVLERQISHRIDVLAAEVIRIAVGDDERPVAIDGDDEIGQIARSLKVFRENARELRRSNEELGRFAYAAAHDMRSPLRAIESLATWTLEDAGDSLSGDSRDNLETLLQRAQRLSRLQADLLDYAQIGGIDSAVCEVDMPSLVEELHLSVDPDRRFEIALHGATDHPLRTHRVPLRQILLNLFDNAIKHHDDPDGTGRIELTFGERDTKLHVEVRDDGPGIEPRFHERVFGLFTTLQARDVVEGSGLGLSRVRKLVERFDGHITIVSDPEHARGTVFRFDLPMSDEAVVPTDGGRLDRAA